MQLSLSQILKKYKIKKQRERKSKKDFLQTRIKFEPAGFPHEIQQEQIFLYEKYVRLKFSTSKIKITKNKKIHPGVTAYKKKLYTKKQKNKAGK